LCAVLGSFALCRRLWLRATEKSAGLGIGVAPVSWTVHGFRTTRRLGAVVHS
jgi:hypothetical protein